MYIPERFIRHIWKNLYLRLADLKTADGKAVKILSPGRINSNEGADFLDAKLVIDGVEKSGNVEIHSQTSDWLRHHHSSNSRYADLVLHVVFEHDTELGNAIPVLELKPFLTDSLHSVVADCIRDEAKLQNKPAIHCQPMLDRVKDELKLALLQRLSEERLVRKSQSFAEKLEGENYDDLIYGGLARALGYSENTKPMERVAARVSFNALRESFSMLGFSERRLKIESVLFALSGLLVSDGDAVDNETMDYVERLKSGFNQSAFVGHQPLDRREWVFFRLRPSNFPTLRLAGLAEVLSKNLERGFLETTCQIMEMGLPLKRRIVLLENLFIADAEGYWQTHYLFGSAAKVPIKSLVGKNRAAEVVINTLLPVMLLYAHRGADKKLEAKVLEFYDAYPKGLTSEVAKKTLEELLGDGYSIRSAAFEQGLLELKKNYCDAFRCLECEIGKEIFRK
ncbi:MAG: DUF2851 family protein [Chlorobiales bacterium]|nr:DUF2851 family protein [Chlorobiales bacterium]